ncbi:hypothetical protein BU14_0474s0004 [Porphyra umbilicalis]|uniref:Uncharacterized protein n=1 Tax=Porphyra umbilicalis TaxID=2786 RepID=A0A1X6NTX5_PORUM|nr:hypothetical protein BU14_0474s0004 [Porphyra umbilicalis]|eukprot:OSX72058.1 hypothetical protein BU14_0474s0004 [Porphyra umbilicalis]
MPTRRCSAMATCSPRTVGGVPASPPGPPRAAARPL